jgi:hypothetical protein
MAFSGNYLCTSFKVELLKGIHNFTTITGDVFKLALYDNTVSFNASTTAYTTSGEVAASGSYAVGGGVLTTITPVSSGTIALASFETLTFTGTNITAYGALIYNSSAAGNPTVCVIDFGGPMTSVNSDFTVNFPPDDNFSAIIRIA